MIPPGKYRTQEKIAPLRNLFKFTDRLGASKRISLT